MTREEDLLAVLAVKAETINRLAQENAALRVALGARGIGGGIDLTDYAIVFVHKPCGQVADPGGHVCSP